MDLEKEGADFSYQVGKKTFKGVDLIATIFSYLRQRADRELKADGVEANGVVLGVPVQYGDIQKGVLKSALVKAGFYETETEADQKTEFVSEPVAVAVHYGLKVTDNKTVLIFDFGGGTLDLAIVNLKEQVGPDHLHPHEVKAKVRLTLGGEELSRLFFIHTICGDEGYGTKEIARQFGFSKNITPEKLWERLSDDNIGVEFLQKVEGCKCELSRSKACDLSYIGPNNIAFDTRKIYRESFEEAIDPILLKIKNLIDDCLEKAGVEDKYQIDHVIIAGGSSLIPCIQELLYGKFGPQKVSTQPGTSDKYVNPEKEVLTSIVRGLAAVGCRKEVVEDVVDNDYGVWIDEDEHFEAIIKNGTLVKNAAKFNKLNCEKDPEYCETPYIEVKTENEDQGTVTIKIFQHNINGNEKLGSVYIDDAGSGKYRIFMHYEPKQGMLLVDIYDRIRRRWFDIPLEQKEYRIKSKN